jgi:hypothetical protein
MVQEAELEFGATRLLRPEETPIVEPQSKGCPALSGSEGCLFEGVSCSVTGRRGWELTKEWGIIGDCPMPNGTGGIYCRRAVGHGVCGRPMRPDSPLQGQEY